MLNISYSSVFVDSSGDNSLYAVCSRLEICTVHWVSLVPGYLWSRYLHFSCQQEKKLLSLFSWMWELTNFFFFKMFNDLFSSIQSVTIFHHLTKFTENIPGIWNQLRFKPRGKDSFLNKKSLILILVYCFTLKTCIFLYTEICFLSALISFKQRKLFFTQKTIFLD